MDLHPTVAAVLDAAKAYGAYLPGYRAADALLLEQALISWREAGYPLGASTVPLAVRVDALEHRSARDGAAIDGHTDMLAEALERIEFLEDARLGDAGEAISLRLDVADIRKTLGMPPFALPADHDDPEPTGTPQLDAITVLSKREDDDIPF